MKKYIDQVQHFAGGDINNFTILKKIKESHVKENDLYIPEKEYQVGESFYGFMILDRNQDFQYRPVEGFKISIGVTELYGNQKLVPIKFHISHSAYGPYDLEFYTTFKQGVKVTSKSVIEPEYGKVIRNSGFTYFVNFDGAILKIDRSDLEPYENETDRIIERYREGDVVLFAPEEDIYKLCLVDIYTDYYYAFVSSSGHHWATGRSTSLKELIDGYEEDIKVIDAKEYRKNLEEIINEI